jgi:hypothetical protein
MDYLSAFTSEFREEARQGRAILHPSAEKVALKCSSGATDFCTGLVWPEARSASEKEGIVLGDAQLVFNLLPPHSPIGSCCSQPSLRNA